MLLGDFHIHSTFSDGKLTIPQIVDLYGQNGFDVIAITDHVCEQSSVMGKFAQYFEYSLTEATFPLYLEILKSEAERAWEQYEMLLIPGVEVTKNSIYYPRSAHILALGVQEFISADQPTLEILKEIRGQNGLSVAAHPVPNRKSETQTLHLWDNRDEFGPWIDAWEVASGAEIFIPVLTSQYAKLASSDLHVRKQINSWKTKLKAEKSQASVFSAIRNQNVDFILFKEKHGSFINPLFASGSGGNTTMPLGNKENT